MGACGDTLRNVEMSVNRAKSDFMDLEKCVKRQLPNQEQSCNGRYAPDRCAHSGFDRRAASTSKSDAHGILRRIFFPKN
jgi:hypothetical protein